MPKKSRVIDTDKHLVLQAPHPSPLSAHRGFFGCRHFSQANAYLQQHQRQTIDWCLENTVHKYFYGHEKLVYNKVMPMLIKK